MANIADVTREYFAALANGVTGESLAAFYHPEIVQEELPNRLMPAGARRNLAQILDAAASGQRVMSTQRYEIDRIIADGDQVAVEFRWIGTLAISLGTLEPGAEMRGRFASFLEFRDGRIISQRSYDCFEPW